jgi:hypothetical protein
LRKFRIAVILLALTIAVAVAVEYPEIRRYVKMKRM